MRDLRVGIVACGAIQKEIEICAGQMENTCNVYPLFPSCAFIINIDLFRDRLKKSIRENDVTVLAYGLCHPKMNSLLREYDASVKRLAGCCCYKMILGAEKYAEYHKKCYWMLQKPFFIKWRKEVEGGFGIGSKNGRQLVDDHFEKLLYIKFEHDELDPDVVRKFSDQAGLDYEVYNADTTHLSMLLKEAVSAVPHVRKGSTGTRTMQDAEQTEGNQILGSIDEIVYTVDLHDKSFSYVSPQVEKILGYTKWDFMDMASGHIQGEFYDERDKNRVITSRYNYIAWCLLGNVGKYEVEYRARDAAGRSLWIMETMNPVYNKKEPVIGCFVGTLRDITKHKGKENDLQTTIQLLKDKLTTTRGVLKKNHVLLKNEKDARLIALDYHRESEEKYRIIADFTYDWEYWLGPDGQYLYVSPACERITGFPPHEFMTDPDLMLKITHPDDRFRFAAHLEAVMCGGADASQMDFRIINRVGGACWIGHECQDVYARDGRWIGRRGSNRDISQQKKAEETLSISEETFSKAFHSGPLMMTISDIETGEYLEVNDIFTQTSGYNREEAIGKTSMELGWVNFGDRKRMIRELRAFGRVKGLVIKLRKKNGDTAWCSFFGEIITVFGKERLLSIAEDITDRKHREEELIIKDNAITSSISALAFLDLEGKVIYVNPATVTMWGYLDEKDIMGRNITEFFQDAKAVSDIIQSLSKGEHWVGKLRARKKGGTISEVQISANLVKDQKGRPLRFMVSATDISEQERMKGIIIQADKISSLEKLSAGLAHELRNPLAIISSCSQFCLEKMKLPPDVDKNIQMIYRNSQRAGKLINDLLTFAKHSPVDWRELSINESISRMIRMYLPEGSSRDISIEMVLDPHLPLVVGDVQKIGQVFLNILINAVESIKKQGKVMLQSRHLHSEGMVEVVITDNGSGITEENLARIFDPFFTTKENGTGLGLSISRTIVEQHNGRIDVHCGSEGGTRISVMFPVHDREPDKAKPGPAKRKDNKTIREKKK